MKYLFPFREYSQSYFSSVKSSLPTTLFQALRSRVNGGNYFSLPINATFMGQYEMYMYLGLPPLPAPICKEGSGKTKQINFIKTNTQHPLSKERGTIQLKLFAANFRFYTCRWFFRNFKCIIL